MRQENACMVRGKSGQSFGWEPDCRVKSRSWRTDRVRWEENLKTVTPCQQSVVCLQLCEQHFCVHAMSSREQHFTRIREQLYFSWRVGTVFSEFMHTTHPFCKAVGSYASVIPPWENNTQDSEPVRSFRPCCADLNSQLAHPVRMIKFTLLKIFCENGEMKVAVSPHRRL